MTPLESIAHDLICIVKFNGTGGTATAAELKRVTAYLARLGKLPDPEPAALRVALPHVTVALPTLSIRIGSLPAIRIAPPKP